MVGIGGRSKACANCRRRRVKCDETRPRCNKCIKAKLDCRGPASMTVIQYQGRRDQEKDLHPSEAANTALTSPPIQNDAVMQSPMRFYPAFQVMASEDNVFMSYTHANLMDGQEHYASIALEPNKGQLATKCYIALSTTYFGAEHRQPILVHRGLRQYGEALTELNLALGNSSHYHSYDLLESIMVMALFEASQTSKVHSRNFLTNRFVVELLQMFESTSQNGWINHSCGLERLMELRGPMSFSSLPELAILERSKVFIIMAALLLRRPTIFSRPEWKHGPWTLHPERRSILHGLYDILADCTELYVMKDKADSDSSPDHENIRYLTVLQKTQDILGQLEQWERSWNLLYPDCYHEVPATQTIPSFLTPQGIHAPAWTRVFRFTSLFHANAVGLLNATLILLLKLQVTISCLNDGTLAQTQILKERIFASGIRVCRSVDYHTDSSRDGAGSLFLLFPLRMAYMAVHEQAPMVSHWLKEVLQKISLGSAGRWGTAGYLLELGGKYRKTPT